MTLGAYSFDPVPTISIADTVSRTESGKPFNILSSMTLNGRLLGGPNTSCGTGSLNEVIKQQQTLREAIDCSGCIPFQITCGTGVLVSENVRVRSLNINESSDNWVLTAPYTIELEYNTVSGSDPNCLPCIRSINDNWSIQPQDQRGWISESGCDNSNFRYYNISRNLSAAGYDCCINGNVKPGYLSAKEWVVSRLTGAYPDLLSDVVDIGSIGDFTLCDHNRIISSSVENGTYDLQETWVAVISGTESGCLHDFTVEERFDSRLRYNTYTISGNITGFEKRDSNFNLISTKLTSALQCWQIIEPDLASDIGCHYAHDCNLNSIPISYSVSKRPGAGTVSYSYTFDERPVLLVSGVISESINIQDTKPSSVIARTPVIGRLAGPVLYDTNTTSERTRNVSINVIVPKPTGCFAGTALCDRFNNIQGGVLDIETPVEQVLCCVESQLQATYDKVFKINDTCNYDPVLGSYQRNTSWIYQKCEDPVIYICSGIPQE